MTQMIELLRELPPERRVDRVREILNYRLPAEEHVEAELHQRALLVTALRLLTTDDQDRELLDTWWREAFEAWDRAALEAWEKGLYDDGGWT
jgi:hypothetical protein